MKIKFYEFFSKKLLLQFDVVFDSGKKIVTSAVYRQLGDSNSQWHKKNLQEGPVGGSASWGNSSWGKCQLEDKNLTFGRAIFLQF